MLELLKNVSDFLGTLLIKFLSLLPHSAFTYEDLVEGIDLFNETHFLNFLNWFIPVQAIITLINLWLVGITATIAGLMLYRYFLNKGGK